MTYNGDGSVSSVFVVRLVGDALVLLPLDQWAPIDKLPSYADEALGTSILVVLFANIVVYLVSYKLTK